MIMVVVVKSSFFLAAKVKFCVTINKYEVSTEKRFQEFNVVAKLLHRKKDISIYKMEERSVHKDIPLGRKKVFHLKLIYQLE